jgi:hypothetical protein
MRQLVWILGIFSLCLICFFSCSRESADINEEVVFDKHPLFGRGGIDRTPLQEGSCLKSPYTKAYKFVMTPIQYEEGFTNLVTKDQTSVNLNAFLTLQIQRGKTPRLLEDFGMDWYRHNVQERFREIVRDKLCSFPMLALVGQRQLYDGEIKEHLITATADFIRKKGVPVDVLSVVISKVEPPEEVRKEMNNLSIETSKLQTEQQRLLTEEARLAAEIAKAKADKAYCKEMGFTPAQYIDYLRALALQNRSDIIRFENIK